MRNALRVTSLVLILVSVCWGFCIVTLHTDSSSEDLGVAMVRLLYEYDTIQDVYSREEQLRSKCTDAVWEKIGFQNESHWNGTWERSKNTVTRVRVVMTRPGLVIYALDSEFVYPGYLWCFEYTIERGLFTSIREYQLVGMRESKDGGFF